MRFYHNPRCSKSRAALELLGGRDVEVVEYLKHPLSVEELRDVCTLLGISPVELLRKKEQSYKDLVAERGEPDDETALEWMHEHPVLMERPILVKEDEAVIGRPPENVRELL